jgi:PPM family protein phosphatase
MAVTTNWRCAAVTDPGQQRTNNEDAYHADPDRGIFLVVDGVGGKAAGEKAAQVAVSVIRTSLERMDESDGDTAEQIREAITTANNEIYSLAQNHPEWKGMACVLTVAVLEGRQATIGHVGDTRLYKIRHGDIRKITPDHSPVGEREDRGELGEREAMQHPRRNEVFRDVGSEWHGIDSEDFIEIIQTPFPADAALLLCSDGLTDLVTQAEIQQIVEAHAGDPHRIARELVSAANEAGGRDNITVLFVQGSRFPGDSAKRMETALQRQGATRRMGPAQPDMVAARIAAAKIPPDLPKPESPVRWWLVTLLLAGIVGGSLALWHWRWGQANALPSEPRTLSVGAGTYATIQEALEAAREGDTVEVPPGEYGGPIELKEGVRLVSQPMRGATIRAGAGSGYAVAARGLKRGHLYGFRILGDAGHPLAVGVQVVDADVELMSLEISGASAAGVEISGNARPVLFGNWIHSQTGAGVVIRESAEPELRQNYIRGTGVSPTHPRAGIEILLPANPRLIENTLADNGVPGIGPLPPGSGDQAQPTGALAPGARPASRIKGGPVVPRGQ